MGMVRHITDGLVNLMSGRGTTVDKRAYNLWTFNYLLPEQAEAAYRDNWLARKIVDIPAKDMCREGRNWQAEDSEIELVEKEEQRLALWDKLREALILARLFGGAALIVSTGDTDAMQPLDPELIGKDGLKYLHVVSRYQLNIGPEITNPESEWFGKPEWFQINAGGNFGGQTQLKLHPSRVIDFVGQAAPKGTRYFQTDSWFWGDSILQALGEPIKDAMTATGGFASLIDEAKIDIIRTPQLMDLVGTEEGETRMLARLKAAQLGKSTWRLLQLDKEEEWQQHQITWAGIPDVINCFIEKVAGAADIPVTRFLGQSPKGLQSTGKGEQQDYHAKVMADQNEILRPALERLDDILIRSAMGDRPDDIYWEFASLDQADEAKDSEIDKRTADTLKVYSDMALFEDEALQAIAKNKMIESGRWPGCEAAFEANPDVPEEEADPDAGKTMAELAAEKAAALQGVGAITGDQATMLMADARPRTLYVSRRLVNAAELLAWAKGQGIPEPMDAGSLHVTVCYSKTPLDWLKVEAEDWNQEKDGTITVPPGGARIVERLGDKGAVVLLFSSSRLAWRHEQIMRAGGSHDFEDYTPHCTISWNVPADFDLDAVEPYRGKLVFGPEIFAEIDEDWTPPVQNAA